QRTRTELRWLVRRIVERVVTTKERDRVFVDTPEPIFARVDVHRIARVLTNLLQDALEYAPAPSKIIVRLEHHVRSARILVIDRGRGLAAQEMISVFDKYTRSASSSETDGSGLGLYVCRKIVEAHGGRIG